MAFASTTNWEVRTTGSDSNGGGFDVSSSGTDYSQQDTPQVTYTDLVIDATTNTKCTSAAFPFVAADVGNIINITSGTGFSVQRVQVVSVTSNVATCDKSLGTLSSTGGHGKLGGGLLTPGTAVSVMTSQNIAWIQAGTYTITTQMVTNAFSIFNGYQTVHGDHTGTRPLLTCSNGSNFFNMGSGGWFSYDNINFQSTGGSRGNAVYGVSVNSLAVSNCTIDGASTGVSTAGPTFVTNCEIKNCTTSGISNSNPVMVDNCYIHSCVIGIASAVGGAMAGDIGRSIITGNTTGITVSGGGNSTFLKVHDCTVTGQSGDGITITGGAPLFLHLVSNIIYNNGGWGVNGASSKVFMGANQNNGYGSNTSGNRSGFAAGPNDFAITAGPFTNSGSGDYSLNATAGGGVACKLAGYPGAFPGGTSTGFLDAGAVQTSGGGGGGSTGASYVFLS